MRPDSSSSRGRKRSPFRLPPPAKLKTVGYLISTVSVILLAIVAWPKAKESAFLFACLIGGALASMMGMTCRWLSYEIEERRKRDELHSASGQSAGSEENSSPTSGLLPMKEIGNDRYSQNDP